LKPEIVSHKMPTASYSDTLVMDNGGYSIKVGYSSQSSPRLVPNCIMKAKSEKRRAFVGDQVEDCRDLSSLFFLLPFQKGYLVNWDHQKTVWDYVFGKECLNLRPDKLNLIFTEPYFNFSSIQEGLSEIFFEEYGFKSLLRTHPGDLSCYKNKIQFPDEKGCLVVDCGFSFTHIAPYVLGKRVRNAVKRIDVGGKLLTNHLKEITSYRQLHVLDETHVMNGAKEDCCYVAQDWDKEVKVARARGAANTIARDYVLPDFTSIRRGVMKSMEESTGRPGEGEQIIRMNNERFMVPEVLFRPSDIGICQMGVSEAVVEAVTSCDLAAQPWLLRNIVLTGGSVKFPGFRERLEAEVRSLAPGEMEVRVREVTEDPLTSAWRGGASLASDRDFRNLIVTKEEYMESGFSACQRRFYL